MKFYCPDCNQKLEAEEDMFGTVIPCPVCETNIKVPFPEPEDSPEPAPTDPTATGPSRKPGGRILAFGWTCFAFGALMLVAAAVAAMPLPSPVFLAASCALGAFAIYRKRKIPGYALVVCGILLLPLSVVLVAQIFTSRARAEFGAPAPRTEQPATQPVQPVPEDTPADPEPDPQRHSVTANARRILKSVEPPPPGRTPDPEPATDTGTPDPETVTAVSQPERKLSDDERKEIFALFMAADERASREAAAAADEPDAGKGKRSRARLQQKLATKYKREIEERFGLSAKQSREILAEGIDAGLEELPD